MDINTIAIKIMYDANNNTITNNMGKCLLNSCKVLFADILLDFKWTPHVGFPNRCLVTLKLG